MLTHRTRSVSCSREQKRLLDNHCYMSCDVHNPYSYKHPVSRPRLAERSATVDSIYPRHSYSEKAKITRRKLPQIPIIRPFQDDNFNDAIYRSEERVQPTRDEWHPLSEVDLIPKNYESTQYHGYDSDGSIAETTIHVSIDKQDADVNNSAINYDHPTYSNKNDDGHQSHSLYNNRKKCLSLDVKSSYESTTDLGDPTDSPKTVPKLKDDDAGPRSVKSKSNKEKIKRRHSDSVFLRTSSFNSDSSQDCVFKKMPERKASHVPQSNDPRIDTDRKSVVSISEILSFQEYRSPDSQSPVPSVDLSLKEPLQSIIKKARSRSHSLASGHLERELCMFANCLSVALSPAPPAAPAASPPHDAPDPSTSDDAPAKPEFQTIQSMANQKRNPRPRNKKPAKSGSKKPRGKTGSSRRGSKRSNEYGGRENGRGGHQPQPLERRDSRRSQFTRSLSNADGPPDEKAGEKP